MGICETDTKTKTFILYESSKFSIMSYNIKVGNDTLRNNVDGSRNTRIKYTINNILLYKPDSIGFQEVTFNKNPNKISGYKILNEGLKDYYIGVGQGRDKGNQTEGNPIFYNKDKFELLEQGTKWLSPTPDVPYTKFENPSDGYKRTLTYVILKNKIVGNIYMHINTHLDYKVKINRLRQVKVIKDFIFRYTKMFPILLTGDFNSTKAKGDAIEFLLNNGCFDSAEEARFSFRHWTYPAIGYINNIYKKCLDRKRHNSGRNLEAQHCCGPECDAEHGKVIDFCLRCNDKIYFEKYQVITDCISCGGISSDHYPIYIEGYFIN